MAGYLQTGQTLCYDDDGKPIDCAGTGQDGEFHRGLAWPAPRFEADSALVRDRLTGLLWSRNANPAEFPLSWQEALDFVAERNDERTHGRDDWRLPNRRELRSILSFQSKKPALPEGHPFEGVQEIYWSSTTSFFETTWAWALYLTKGATGVGVKGGETFHVWPVVDG